MRDRAEGIASFKIAWSLVDRRQTDSLFERRRPDHSTNCVDRNENRVLDIGKRLGDGIRVRQGYPLYQRENEEIQ